MSNLIKLYILAYDMIIYAHNMAIQVQLLRGSLAKMGNIM